MSPHVQKTLDRIDDARQRWWLFTLLSTLATVLAGSIGLFLGFMLLDAVFILPQSALAALTLIWFVVTIFLVIFLWRRLVRSNSRSLAATARRLELLEPELGSRLINVVQLGELVQESGGEVYDSSHVFALAAAHTAAIEVDAIAFEQALQRQNRRQRFHGCMQTQRDFLEAAGLLGLLILIGLLASFLLPNWSSAAGRLFMPWQFVPSTGVVEITEVTPGDADVMLGDSLAIGASVRVPADWGETPLDAVVILTGQKGVERQLPLTVRDSAADKPQPASTMPISKTAVVTLPAITEPFRYRLQIGDSQSEIFSVSVHQKPTIERVDVTYHFPAYLNRPPLTIQQRHADLEAPQFSTAELHVSTNTPVDKGWAELGTQRYPGRVGDDGQTLTIERIPMAEDGRFTIHLENASGHTDPAPRKNQLHVVPDQPPTVSLLKPARQATAAIGGKIELVVRAGDDNGLSHVELQFSKQTASNLENSLAVEPRSSSLAENQDDSSEALPSPAAATAETPQTITSWTEFPVEKAAVLKHELPITAELASPGQTLLVRAVVEDTRRILASDWGKRLDPQSTVGPWHAVQIIAKEDEAVAELAQIDSLRTAIYQILLDQLRVRTDAARLEGETSSKTNPSVTNEATLQPKIKTLRDAQVGIHKTTDSLVESITATEDGYRRTARRELNRLSVGPMVEAVRCCDLLQSSSGESNPLFKNLTTEQTQIVNTLRSLLDEARRAEEVVASEMKERLGGDLPDDVRTKLEDINKRLEEFLEQQKRVIEATESLAKKPVEDFSEEDEQKLADLAASQDEWARLMKELHSDMSKLPEQDFANSSMLTELVEIQTELKMAEDALTKKTVDIAVPLEQLGYEMAEEIKTNMEKWLPDTPDRERWSQEESLTDADKEAPMAELPGELEDLIGELMEEEEDLFDEMEDVTSSAADSLDAGAGWDAADGPISNMSAKGVTGNRLPNTSEIGGRSGEGRSGKSSGEFVGNEAIGKGGRKTPSRLTADPFEKGQVADHSRDPQGGATGGGKESGQGGEGLEGPQRRAFGARDLQRLAGKQAALRNKAESIDLKFQIMNYHHTDLEKMVEEMGRVERDLKAGRYQNALRRRQVLAEGLSNIKQYVEGEFEVREDATENLPAEIQKKIFGAMEDPSPLGWEELNREYYRSLSE